MLTGTEALSELYRATNALCCGNLNGKHGVFKNILPSPLAVLLPPKLCPNVYAKVDSGVRHGSEDPLVNHGTRSRLNKGCLGDNDMSLLSILRMFSMMAAQQETTT